MSDPSSTLIKLARLRSGLTQRELAHKAGTSQPTLAAYETARKFPSLQTLTRILKAAGFDLRFRLEPADPHDEVIRAYEQRLPPSVLEKVLENDRSRVAQARGRSGAIPER